MPPPGESHAKPQGTQRIFLFVFFACLAALREIFLLLQLLPPQDVVVVLREAVRLVAHVLQQPQRRRVPAQAQRFLLAGPENLFVALGQVYNCAEPWWG